MTQTWLSTVYSLKAGGGISMFFIFLNQCQSKHLSRPTSILYHQPPVSNGMGKLEIIFKNKFPFGLLNGQPLEWFEISSPWCARWLLRKLAETRWHLGDQQQQRRQARGRGALRGGGGPVTGRHLGLGCVSAWKISMAAEKLFLKAHASTSGYPSS